MKSLIEYINESNNIELTSDGNEHGFEYVDLGLPSGTMWATCNVGADKPEYQGLFFQFGRVDGYKHGDKNNTFTTDDKITTSGKVYKKNNILDLEDDAAHVNMGGKWRMPTKNECTELFDNTTHDVVTINGVKGMLLTSNINNNQLFIPFNQGCWYDENWETWNYTSACVWSSQVRSSNGSSAYVLSCYSNGNTDVNNDYCSTAYLVRGVFKK